MILGIPWAIWLAWLLALFFLVSGIANYINPRKMREEYARWDLPRWINYVTGTVELVGALLLAIPATRALGLILGALLCFAIYAVLIRSRDYGHLGPSVVLLAAILIAGWGLYG